MGVKRLVMMSYIKKGAKYLEKGIKSVYLCTRFERGVAVKRGLERRSEKVLRCFEDKKS